jgi:oxygen-independent coproporphyrinogen-3 oxidase
MLSLYIHIPFCNQKCKYCSFNIFPVNNLENSQKIIDNYISSLEKEIDFYADYFWSQQIKSIYFWWGTPSKIWSKNIIRIIDRIQSRFNLENLAELSLEFNPYPKEEIYELVKTLNNHYKWFSRLRYSFWIQSFDNKILQEAWRETSFLWLVDFLRGLRELKQENNVFNFDFIAFGKFNETRKWNLQLRDQNTLDFFQNFVNSLLAESFSLYTLELFPWSLRYHQDKNKDMFADDDIYEEFSLLKELILDAGYIRYELSNFSKLWKSSIHNRVYRDMENYIWLWVSGSSFLNSDIENYQKFIKKVNSDFDTKNKWIRITNTQSISDYINWNFIDQNNIQILKDDDYLIEKFFLGLRTDQWIADIDEFKSVLVANYQSLIETYQKDWFCILNDKKMKLTDHWMDVFNSIITDLLEKI